MLQHLKLGSRVGALVSTPKPKFGKGEMSPQIFPLFACSCFWLSVDISFVLRVLCVRIEDEDCDRNCKTNDEVDESPSIILQREPKVAMDS